MRRRALGAPATVARLMKAEVPAVEPATSLTDVARRMRRDRVGAVAVMRGTELVGIVTERDLMRAVADGVDPRQTSVSERMTAAPRTIAADQVAADAAELMVELGVRHLPVTQDGAVVGMISARDLLHLGRRPPKELLGYEPW